MPQRRRARSSAVEQSAHNRSRRGFESLRAHSLTASSAWATVPRMPEMPIAEQLVLLAELAAADAKHKQISDKLESVPAAARKADEATAALKKALDEAAAKKA